MKENEFILEDRIAKIKAIAEEYGEANCYVSFSGGKDSCVLSELIDLALPGNKIPRVYKDTGIEYRAMRNYVKQKSKKDNRFIYLKPERNIKRTLEQVGYPYKSKQHSHNFAIYKHNVAKCEHYKSEILKRDILERLKSNACTEEDYKYVSSLPKGTKTFIKYYFGIRERERELCTSIKTVPESLKFQFTPEYAKTHNWSDNCCKYFKHGVLSVWENANGIYNTFTGMRKEEGGNREHISCITNGKNGKHFNVLAPVSKAWEEWFIKEYHIKLCKLYYPPYNFERTGCLCCPFSKDLKQQLEILKEFDKKTYKQAQILWKPVYEDYRKHNYRLQEEQPTIFDFIEED